MKKNFNYSITNILAVLSLLWTILYLFFYNYISYLPSDLFILDFFTHIFFHANFFHFLGNMIFLVYFWNILEDFLWRNKYFILFIFSTIFSWFSIVFFTGYYNLIWISGFCMAILSYYTLDLKEKNNPEYKWGINWIFLGILIGFIPQVSLLWHLFWVISGIIFYYINKEFLRKKMIWLTK